MLRLTRSPFAVALLSGSFAVGGVLSLAGCGGDEGQTYGTDVAGADDEHVHAEAEHGAGRADGERRRAEQQRAERAAEQRGEVQGAEPDVPERRNWDQRIQP